VCRSDADSIAPHLRERTSLRFELSEELIELCGMCGIYRDLTSAYVLRRPRSRGAAGIRLREITDLRLPDCGSIRIQDRVAVRSADLGYEDATEESKHR
jgi:hypothetical protein